MRTRTLQTEFLLLLIPWLLLVFSVLFSIYRMETYRYTKNLYANEHLQVKLGQLTIKNSLSERLSDIRLLADITETQANGIDGFHNPQIADTFLKFASNRKVYDQIRILDINGLEQVRINFNGGQPSQVPEGKLQNKHDRYYFTDAMELPPNVVFVSKLDLNKEHGEIESPQKPMIRIGIQLHNTEGKLTGLLLLNYLAKNTLDTFSSITASIASRVSIINKEGYWLKHPNHQREWGFMYKNSNRFQRDYPAVWRAIDGQHEGQVESSAGTFTFHSVSPTGIDGGHEPWTIISHLTPEFLATEQQRIWSKHITIATLLMVIFSLICWWLAKARLRHSEATRQLEHSHANLEMRVAKRTEALEAEVNARKSIEMKLRHMASFDHLTGIPNRALFLDRLNNAMAASRRQDQDLALLFLDLDGFKDINDQYGHSVGDQVLIQTSNRLSQAIRESDTAGRFGGDEFVILLLGLNNTKIALSTAHKIRADLKRSFVMDDINVSIGCSIGIAIYLEHSETAEELISRADQAMYQAKEAGKNRVVIAKKYSPAPQE